MHKLLTFQEALEELDKAEVEAVKKELLKEHLSSNKTASFEWSSKFNLCSFDWYDVNNSETETHRILIYLDREEFLVFCEKTDTKEHLQRFMDFGEENNEQKFYHFLFNMLAHDMDYIDDYEDTIIDAEDATLSGHYQGYLEKILEYRKELLRLKRYYTQLQVICDGLVDNENGLISETESVHFNILHNRVDRCYAAILNLQDYVTQMREAYQAQIDIEQNGLMKVFTLITALFLPLSLMVGWYGMNFTNMPELKSAWGYPLFIFASILISTVLIIYFKKKKWF